MSKRKTTSHTEPSPQAAPLKAPWYKRMWIVVVAVGSAAFTLGLQGPTLLQNIRKLPSEVETTRDQYMAWLKDDAAWTGDWSNTPEGVVNMADMHLSEGVGLKISIQAKNGEIDGIISSSKACENIPMDYLLLRGTVSGNAADVEIWDIIGGKEHVFEKIKLIREEIVLTIHPNDSAASWFPSGTRIGKHPGVDEEFLTAFCKGKARSPLQSDEQIDREAKNHRSK